MARLLAMILCLGVALVLPATIGGCNATVTSGGGGQEPECTSDADCLAGQICVDGVCVADTGDELPDTLIVAGSRTGHYVIVDPESGEDIVEVEPDTIGTNEPTLGYQCERVYFLSAPTTGTGRADIFGCDAMTGENVVNLTADLTDFSASTPEGSPVEPKLAFTNSYDNHVYVINEDGTGLAQLTFDDETHTLLDGTAVIALGEGLPTWSPGGSQIAYQARVGEVGSIGMQYEVVIVMDASGANKEIIYDRQGTAHYREISWSHDGNFVVFSDEEDGRQVRAVSVASMTVSTLTDALLAGTTAAFGNMWMSPTDFRIVFNYYLPGGGSLYMAELQATGDTVGVVVGTTQLTEDAVGHGYALPDWAPGTGTGGGQEPECTSDADCLAGQICVDGVCVADTGDELPDTLIVAGSRTGHYVIVDPESGEDIVEVEPDTIGTNEPTLGYQCERVYFLSAPTTGTGRADIFGCDAMTGENVVNLTADLTDFSASTPEGSPVEPKLAFTNSYDNHVYVINEDGTGLAQLTFDDETHTLLDGTAVIALGEGLPTWSPGGSQIAYQARVGEVGSIGMQYEVVIVMDASGANKEIIYDRQGTAHYREISWSHDGNFVVFSDEEDGRQVRAVSVASMTVSTLTDALLAGTTAAFGNMWMSPTDFRIVFNYYLPGGGSLYMAELQATGDTVGVVVGTTQLTEDAVGHGYALPDWAPYSR